MLDSKVIPCWHMCPLPSSHVSFVVVSSCGTEIMHRRCRLFWRVHHRHRLCCCPLRNVMMWCFLCWRCACLMIGHDDFLFSPEWKKILIRTASMWRRRRTPLHVSLYNNLSMVSPIPILLLTGMQQGNTCGLQMSTRSLIFALCLFAKKKMKIRCWSFLQTLLDFL